MSPHMPLEKVDLDVDQGLLAEASAPGPATSLRMKAAALSLGLCTAGFVLGLVVKGPNAAASGVKSFSPQESSLLYGQTKEECHYESYGKDSVCRSRFYNDLEVGRSVDGRGRVGIVKGYTTFKQCKDYCDKQDTWACYGFEYRNDDEGRCELWHVPIGQGGKCKDASPCNDLPKPLPPFECVARVCITEKNTPVAGCAMEPVGPNTVCRLASVDHTVDGHSSAQVLGNVSYSACLALCNQLPEADCYGVEHRNDNEGRCEIWKKPIVAKDQAKVKSWDIDKASFECVPRKCYAQN